MVYNLCAFTSASPLYHIFTPAPLHHVCISAPPLHQSVSVHLCISAPPYLCSSAPPYLCSSAPALHHLCCACTCAPAPLLRLHLCTCALLHLFTFKPPLHLFTFLNHLCTFAPWVPINSDPPTVCRPRPTTGFDLTQTHCQCIQVPEWELICQPDYNNPVSNDLLTSIRELHTKHSTQQPTNSTDREKK